VPAPVERRTVDLSSYPDLVVIYLGMRVNTLAGLKTLIGFGPRIAASVDARPDGLLLHENFLMSLMPMHAGMRQYWRDWESLERWSLRQLVRFYADRGRDEDIRGYEARLAELSPEQDRGDLVGRLDVR